MPDRLLKESICTSQSIDNLPPQAETLFYRIIVNCDDYGRMEASPTMLRSKCFPLRIDQISNDDILNWRQYLESQRLISLYQIDGREYLALRTWGKHQHIKNHRSKCPAPDIDDLQDKPLREDIDIEDLLYQTLTESSQTYNIERVDRQLRVGESYIDLLIRTKTSQTFVVELKRNRLSNKSINQIINYLKLQPLQGASGLLIGTGLAVNFQSDLCNKTGIAVFTYDEKMVFKPVCTPTWITSDFTVNPILTAVTSRYPMLVSNPIQSESNPNPIPNNKNPKDEEKFRLTLKFIENCIGPLSTMGQRDEVIDISDNYSLEVIENACKEATLSSNGKPNLKYLLKKLNNMSFGDKHDKQSKRSTESPYAKFGFIEDGPDVDHSKVGIESE